MDFVDAVLDGIPLLPVVMGLVEYAKKFGAKDAVCDALSLGLGLLFGVLYRMSTGGLPTDLAGWFGTVLYGLALGLTASGLWRVVQNAAKAVGAATRCK